MTITVSVLTILIYIATTVVVIAPVALLVLWLKDFKEGHLW